MKTKICKNPGYKRTFEYKNENAKSQTRKNAIISLLEKNIK